MIDQRMTVPAKHEMPEPGRRWRIAICGGGVAAIESLLALRALLGLAPHIDLIAPNRCFVYEPLTVAEPFGLAETRLFDLAAVAAEHSAELHAASLEAVEPDIRHIALSDGARLSYDSLIVAVGARRSSWLPGALQFSGAGDVSSFRQLLAQLERCELSRVAFAAPAEIRWMLPVYELALLTASWIADRHLTGVELAIVTPEHEPLEDLGPAASRAMRAVLSDRGIRLHVNERAEKVEPGALQLAAGDALEVDRVVAIAKLEGPRVAGLPADGSGFIQIDDHARAVGLDDVYAAGDATTFPIKQGGIATQHADAAVETIAARLGAGAEPPAFQPVLRAMLLTGVAPIYLRAVVGRELADQVELDADPLWWPPTKIAGRYIGPYLAETERRRDSALEHRPVSSEHPGQVHAGHRRARELALSFALSDANSEDYRSALRWLEVVEQLDGALPPGYDERRDQWRRQADSRVPAV